MKRLLKLLEFGELVRRMGVYLRSDDPFYVKSRHGFGVFVATINSHAESGKPRLEETLESDAAATDRRRRAMRGEA